MRRHAALPAFSLCLVALAPQAGDASDPWIQAFEAPRASLSLARAPLPGAFFDVVGRRAAAFGYEGRGLEVWAYPLKLLDDFRLAFRIQGYPLELQAADLLSHVEVRPEATLFTYSHAAFTVRQLVFAPIDEPAVAMLLDVRSTLPLTLIGAFRPRLRLMWPAGLMTGDVAWEEKARLYVIAEESKRFVAVIGSPAARDLSVMPYQEEPRDVPLRFEIHLPDPKALGGAFVPIVMVGSVRGKEDARASYDRVLSSLRPLYEATAAHYRSLLERTVGLATPDARLDVAFAWAKVGVDKGLATNPLLGTGLLAGFRTSGDSERPGFGWFFGRDALWTAPAIHSYGDPAAGRSALSFLARHQRADGKIPHEISQSASLIPWFTDYPYPWNSIDATPLYLIAHADHYQTTGDRAFLEAAWDSLLRAFRFAAAADADGNGLVDNTKFGHGWVEGGALYPPHEEIYLQGVWIAACRGFAGLANALGQAEQAALAEAAAEKARAALEAAYWLPARGFYAFATKRPAEKPPEAEPGPSRERRQARLDELASARLVDEDTVFPAVPLWFRTLDRERAQAQLDHLGSAALATDWGSRSLADDSRLYDPLSYHYGSVWPLFSGWAALGAYRHGRPHVGYQALMATVLLTRQNALGYVTELLSGEFNAPFGRSSHHQIWSEAMVITPLLRGLLGIEAGDAGRLLRFAPQLPADWDRVNVTSVPAGDSRFDLGVERGRDRLTLRSERRSGTSPLRLALAPGLPLDARIGSVTVDGRAARYQARREGDVQFVEVQAFLAGKRNEAVFRHSPGTSVHWAMEVPGRGATSSGLRVLRASPERGALRLLLEGRGGRSYALGVRTPHALGSVSGVRVARSAPDRWNVEVAFEGASDGYVRREIALPLGE